MQEVFEKIIEKLEEIKVLMPELVEYQAADDIESRCKEINNLIKEYNNGWIPCGERMPDKSDCPYNEGKECSAAEGCAGYQPKGDEYASMTNADSIRAMSNEQLAEFIPLVSDLYCRPTEECLKNIFNCGECERTKECALKWLQSEMAETD